ncbi:hypothetical protein Goklo_016125 [Gossypium klotzschianum]|uniref:Uncharacterized protein n=1 Tax=Gossypium klotzschianum TaxID=34286 RepID=A0A7J8UD00_9ROSI|nr:hypothetical protein [Gossypium klotzschianum]
MKRCVSGQKVEIFFPYLLAALCKSAEVPMEENEQFMRPTKSLIGPVLQEFARRNNMRIPNYPQDMFGPTHLEHEEDEQKSEEQKESEDEEGEGNENMDFDEEEYD